LEEADGAKDIGQVAEWGQRMDGRSIAGLMAIPQIPIKTSLIRTHFRIATAFQVPQV